MRLLVAALALAALPVAAHAGTGVCVNTINSKGVHRSDCLLIEGESSEGFECHLVDDGTHTPFVPTTVVCLGA